MSRHVETVLPPRESQARGEKCAETITPAEDRCVHQFRCCHGGHGRHTATRPSSSTAGLASFRSAR